MVNADDRPKLDAGWEIVPNWSNLPKVLENEKKTRRLSLETLW